MGDSRYRVLARGNNRPQADLPYGVSANQGWVMPTGVLCKQPPYGGIRAIDLATGKTLWDHTVGLGAAQWAMGHSLDAAFPHRRAE